MKICIFFAAIIFFTYSSVLNHEFINYDDPDYVTDNPMVQAGLTPESIVWAFTSLNFSNWHPVTWLSHMLDYQLYGNDPAGHHLTSLILHIANAILLFLVFFRMTREAWKSGCVAALFAFHPLNVESVTWISERKNVLSFFFFLLTLLAYTKYANNKRLKTYLLVFSFFVLGLMAKPMLVTLPFVLLLIDFWPLRRVTLENSLKAVAPLIFEKMPLFLLTFASCAVTLLAQKLGGAMEGGVSFFARLNNAMVVYITYLGKTVWPTHLSVLYPHPGETLAIWKGVLSALALLIASFLCIRLMKKAPYFAFGWFWYVGTLIPVIGILQVGAQSMADRYTYMPLIGIFCLIVWGVSDFFPNTKFRIKSALAGITLSGLLIVTWYQLEHWKNSITLFTHAIEVTESQNSNFDLAYNNLGTALFEEGQSQAAIKNYKEAIRLNPKYDDAYYNLGLALLSDKKIGQAITQFEKTIELKPYYFKAYNNIGNALVSEGNLEKAILYFQKAIEKHPNFVDAHFNLANAFTQSNQKEKAIYHFKQVTQLQNQNAEAHFKIGTLYYSQLDFMNAIKWFLQSAELGHSTAQYNLGLIYATGQGIPKDFSKARMWWILAGDEEAKQNIVKLEKIMSSEQIQKSEFLKKEWHDGHK